MVVISASGGGSFRRAGGDPAPQKREADTMLQSACPIFPSRNFDATADFYKKLGFAEVARFSREGYLILKRDDVEVHFFLHAEHVPETSEHGAFVRVENADTLSERLARSELPEKGIPRFVKAELKPWGVCELAIVDPDGNLLRIGHIPSDL